MKVCMNCLTDDNGNTIIGWEEISPKNRLETYYALGFLRGVSPTPILDKYNKLLPEDVYFVNGVAKGREVLKQFKDSWPQAWALSNLIRVGIINIKNGGYSQTKYYTGAGYIVSPKAI